MINNAMFQGQVVYKQVRLGFMGLGFGVGSIAQGDRQRDVPEVGRLQAGVVGV